MTHYFCIAIGMADCTPNSQEYHSAESADEMREIIAAACEQWERDLPEPSEKFSIGGEFYSYEFRAPRDGENNWSQRLRIHGSTDCVLDVIGMTAGEFDRESDGE